MERQVTIGGLYRHFKGNFYRVITVASYSEDHDRKLVIYCNENDKSKVWARDLDMFMSEVDHDKYPEVKDKYRFTEIPVMSLKED